MAVKVLVAYGSKYGSTKEIAEKIGEAIKQEGLQVEVLSADKVKDVAGYQGVVIGSASYMFNWRKEVKNFITKNEKTLSERPVWIFSSGPLEKGDPVQLLKGQVLPKAFQPVVDRIKPRDIAVFHGAIFMEKLNFFEKWMMQRIKTGVGDFRDWEMITAWAKKVAADMKK